MGEIGIAGISIMALVLGLVEFAKKFGLQGNGCIILAAVLGTVLAGLQYAMAQSMIPEVALPWINLATFGLGFGLAAAGFYDFSKKFQPEK